MNRIEQAALSDAPTIARFQVAMAEESEGTVLDYERVLSGVSEVMKDEAKGKYLVARDEGGETIGSLLITREWSDWHCCWYWWIQSVYVRLENRRQGVYRAMYQKVKEMAREAQVHCVKLYADRENLRALQTYKALGMAESHYVLMEEEIG